MLRIAILFALGTLAFHQLAWLPGWHWWLFTLPWPVLLLRVARPGLAALIAGFAWSHLFALVTLPPVLPDDDRAMRVVLRGTVVSLVERSGEMARFLVEADAVERDGVTLGGEWRVRLSWRNPALIRPGDVWRLPVRLRAVHGYASPGAWDYEGWLYWQGVRYAGYVSTDAVAERLESSACCRLTRWRGSLSDALAAVPASVFARGVLRAVTVGDTSGLTDEARDLFRRTGTSHLMAISGLHIGLVAGLVLGAVAWIWRRVPVLCARVPARLAGMLAGLSLATAYAMLAGMGLPTQRALIMLAVFVCALLFRRDSSSLHALALAMVLVLIWHPPSIVSAGFWLSFGAVLVIIAVLGAGGGTAPWRTAVRVQLVLTLALWPVLAVFGLPASTAAPLANLVLVPLFGFLVVPLSLLATVMLPFSAEPAALILSLLAAVLDISGRGLTLLAAQPWPTTGPVGDGWPVWLMTAGAVALTIAPVGMPLRWLALPLLAASGLPRAAHLAPGDFELHLLDVGQGLSAVVYTARHTVLFDTGPEYPSGFSAAQAVVAPFLAHSGRASIDLLVLSHGDSDHAGGVRHLLENVAVGEVRSGEAARVGHGSLPCLQGPAWEWDGVAFEFLHPGRDVRLAGNDASCVLRVSNPAGAVLLTGDIEARVERGLAREVPTRLRSDIVVAPHHGSRSSSSDAFIAATRPAWVLYAAGWANRYGFPADDVRRRWRRAGAQEIDTGTSGTVSFRWSAEDGQLKGPTAYRHTHARFWRHAGGSAAAPHAVSSAD